jgi:N-acylglucosamine-6-phosphate 2-epimerase
MLNTGIIISVQAPQGDCLDTYVLRQMARSVLKSEPAGLRVDATVAQALLDCKVHVDCPIIGLTKEYANGLVRITPTVEDAKLCEDAGCEYVATDGTGRWGYEEIEKMLANDIKVVADVYTAEQGKICEDLGCYAVTTALSGYQQLPLADDADLPDLELVKALKAVCKIPIIAEGRYRSRAHIKTAIEYGANNVCMGAAITRPDKIAKQVVKIFSEY